MALVDEKINAAYEVPSAERASIDLNITWAYLGESGA